MRLKVITHVYLHMARRAVESLTRLLVTGRTLELFRWSVRKCLEELIRLNKTHKRTFDLKSLFQCLKSTMNVSKTYYFLHPDDQKEAFKYERVNLMAFMLKASVTFLLLRMMTSNNKFQMVPQTELLDQQI